MPGDTFATDGTGSLEFFRQRNPSPNPRARWFSVRISVPKATMTGGTNSNPCWVGVDRQLGAYLAAGDPAVTVITQDLDSICWNDLGSASYLAILWWPNVQEAAPAPQTPAPPPPTSQPKEPAPPPD